MVTKQAEVYGSMEENEVLPALTYSSSIYSLTLTFFFSWVSEQNQSHAHTTRLFRDGVALRKHHMSILMEKTEGIIALGEGILAFELCRPIPTQDSPKTPTSLLYLGMDKFPAEYEHVVTELSKTKEIIEKTANQLDSLNTLRVDLNSEKTALESGLRSLKQIVSDLKEKQGEYGEEIEKYASEVETLYERERQTMNEMEPFLTSIIKMTERLDSVKHLNSLAKKQQLAWKNYVEGLAAFVTSMKSMKEKKFHVPKELEGGAQNVAEEVKDKWEEISLTTARILRTHQEFADGGSEESPSGIDDDGKEGEEDLESSNIESTPLTRGVIPSLLFVFDLILYFF